MAWDACGRNVLITGASTGIGKELALQLSAQGANVALLARRSELLQEVAAECSNASLAKSKAVPVTCDVTDRPSCKSALEQVVAEFHHIDAVILNAGSSMGCYFEDIKDLADADYLMNLNVMGVVNVLHFALPHVPKCHESRIVVISSVSGALGVPFRTMYCASKWALHGFCASLRTELVDTYGAEAPAIVVSCPPEVATPLNQNRLKFGNATAAEFDEATAASVKTAAKNIIQAMIAGNRLSFFTKMHSCLAMLYTVIPQTIDRLVTKSVRKTHKAERYSNL
eukprot:TRINITY_DN49240_c0_g1_i1.p1 TRINITY_DN49240_c0_g1~~TRINITY_DN49240_c0_g1_i1.p1  ORF type:complete len:283 (+),score=60.33 TRINITY_DN49240_c0_g1_i1:63-911(+)